MGAEVFLKARIQCYVVLVVAVQIKLNIVVAGPGQQSTVQCGAFGRNLPRVGYSVGVLPARGFRSQQVA